MEIGETFYVELSTNDSQIEIFEVCRRIRVSISDNDCKFKVTIDSVMYYSGLYVSDITVTVVTPTEDTIDVNESTGIVRACVNITSGYIESSNAYIRYYVRSGSASGSK